MNAERLIGQAAVVVPILHIATCSIYLGGYSAGFGGHVGTLFGASDLLGISVTELIWTYAFSAALPFVVLVGPFRPTIAGTASKPTSGPQSARAFVSARFALWAFVIFVTLTTFSVVAVTAVAIDYDSRIPYAEYSWPLAAIVSWWWMAFASRHGFNRAGSLAVAIILTLMLAALSNGLTRGQAERRYDADQFIDRLPRCGSWYVLRAAGDRFLAVHRGGRRGVLDADCQLKMLFAPRQPFPRATPYQLIMRWWDSRPVDDNSPAKPRVAANEQVH